MLCCDVWVDCKALKCYHCDSFQTEDCGPLFRATSDVNVADCDSGVTQCVLQRQPAIPQGHYNTRHSASQTSPAAPRARWTRLAYFHALSCRTKHNQSARSTNVPEVHNVSQCHQRRTESRPRVTRAANLVKFGRAVLERCVHARLTPQIPRTVYRYFSAYPLLFFSFSFSTFSCWFRGAD